jgi:hypothetical protein
MASEERREGRRERREHEREGHREEGKDRAVHLAIIAARWAGSVPPTAQAYARALAQWRQLPGATITAATDLGNAAEVPVPGDGGSGESTPP